VIPVGGSTPVTVIDKVRRLVMMASSSLRSLPRIFEIFQNDPDPDAHLPSASGARWWLLRISRRSEQMGSLGGHRQVQCRIHSRSRILSGL
jgi:hypothetical protein